MGLLPFCMFSESIGCSIQGYFTVEAQMQQWHSAPCLKALRHTCSHVHTGFNTRLPTYIHFHLHVHRHRHTRTHTHTHRQTTQDSFVEAEETASGRENITVTF